MFSKTTVVSVLAALFVYDVAKKTFLDDILTQITG